MKLLLAEDDSVRADVITQALHEMGFSIEHAQNGPDALHFLLHFQYEAAILDLGLPGMDVIKALREKKNRIPIDRRPKLRASLKYKFSP
jgi:DNA-binding response OmpR family regulator